MAVAAFLRFVNVLLMLAQVPGLSFSPVSSSRTAVKNTPCAVERLLGCFLGKWLQGRAASSVHFVLTLLLLNYVTKCISLAKFLRAVGCGILLSCGIVDLINEL